MTKITGKKRKRVDTNDHDRVKKNLKYIIHI